MPPGRLTCIAFAEDYVWVGSERGAARFDRLIEQWEYLPLKRADWSEGTSRVYKIQPVGEYVYLATEAGILRFDNQTETLLFYGSKDGLKAGKYRDLRRIGDELWCFGESGIDVYSTSQRNWSFLGIKQGFRSKEWRDIEEIEGDLYFLHSGGIDICEVSSRRVYPFERESRLSSFDARDFYGSTSELWFATDRGLLRYQAENVQTGQSENWILYDQSRGATGEAFHRLAGAGSNIFARSPDGIDVLDVKSEIYIAPLIFPEKTHGLEKTAGFPQVKWDEQGLRMAPSASVDLGLTGNYSYLIRTDEDESSDRHRGRLQPYLNHSSGRSINGLYDNTDPDEIFYGGTYRGKDGDLLRRIEAGNRVQFSQTLDPFFGRTTLRGATAMLEAGPRSETKKRNLFRSNWTFGEVITHSTREFFSGTQGPIYTLKHRDLLVGSAEVSLNGRILSEDEYTLNYTLGQLFFTFSGWELLNEGDIIEVFYQYRLNDDEIGETLGGGEVILSSGDVLQVAVSAFDKSPNYAQADSIGEDSNGGFQGGQIVAEARGHLLNGEGQITIGTGASSVDSNEESAYSGFIEGNFNRGPWTLNGRLLALSDSLATLEDRSTEFGYLEGEDELGIRFEPSGKIWMEGSTKEKRGNTGSERNHHFGGQLSPIPGTSTFGTFDYFDAASDSLDRERWIGSLGVETAFSTGLMEALKLRSSRLLVLGRISEVRLDSVGKPDSLLTELRTQSILTRWTIVPGPNVNFYPEVRWTKSEKSAGGGSFQPDREELAPRGTFYSRDLIPGVTTYLDGEASYVQNDFNPMYDTRNLKLERQGIAQIDLAPGVYLATFNPVSLRFNLVRNAEDSLVGISEEYGLFDLGFGWKDYPTNAQSQRYDSDAMQITWAPGSRWLLYQTATEVRSSGLPVEQYFTTRLEWKPIASDQIYWKYSLNRSLAPDGNELRHRPGLEWYRRWSSKTFTRGQFYATITDEPNLKSWELSPGGYLDRRFRLPWQLGQGTLRTDLSLDYFRGSVPVEETKLSFGGYTRLDWTYKHYLVLRFRADGDYEYSYTTSSDDLTWRLEIRASASF